MKPILFALLAFPYIIGSIDGPIEIDTPVEKKEVATLSGPALPPLIRGEDYSFSATCTFNYSGYYQFYAAIKDTKDHVIYQTGSVISRKRAKGEEVTLSGVFPSSSFVATQTLYFIVYCTTGEYANYDLTRFAELKQMDKTHVIDPRDNSTIIFPGAYHYWFDGSLLRGDEALNVPYLGREAVNSEHNYLEMISSKTIFSYVNTAMNYEIQGAPKAELWLLNHFDDFACGDYLISETPKRRVFPLSIEQRGLGRFYFALKEKVIYDLRNLQMLNVSEITPGLSMASHKFFFPVGYGRSRDKDEPYRYKIVINDFGSAKHYLEFNGTFKRTKENIGYATKSNFYVAVKA